METAAAAIANMIAYNMAAARAESASDSASEPNPAPKVRGFVPSMIRNLDLIGVCALTGSIVAYGALQFRM